jgi:hypothetical protein
MRLLFYPNRFYSLDGQRQKKTFVEVVAGLVRQQTDNPSGSGCGFPDALRSSS